MTFRQCRWCSVSANGEIAILDHERNTHPQLYWQARADSCRAQAKRLMDEADRYDLRAKREGG